MSSGNTNIITKETKVSVLIKVNPLVIDALIAINPNFKKLKNIFLRKLLAPRVSIAEACKIANCDLTDFFALLKPLGFVLAEITSTDSCLKDMPGSSHSIKPEKIIELDVRPVLQNNQDPLKIILKAIKELNSDEGLKITNTFTPTPLINLLHKKGFKYQIENLETDLVITTFFKSDTSNLEELNLPEQVQKDEEIEFDKKKQTFTKDKIICLDVRQLEMPLPMVNILRQLENTNLNEAIFVQHRKVPVFLLPELQAKGFQYLIKQLSENEVEILIFKS
ncbi:MAG: DUF2249 domain-containing protein [Bacteroidetes bacterium]|nr:DUF2249 domain-containing protein [Bacteroidota bacterium]MBU1372693.1 DUF2249 domain-containing protein [Bacteroidota bacterium]MBU1484889.1 DUF2249 domain-containing protein [Bacteroidota bacterium]MBU1762006.1 DUF2249 domain-containing protein [Bacteroidota bacterium]MBU2045459.1 DUF2249 domain-containing protein [Bacteroidota bacterium]